MKVALIDAGGSNLGSVQSALARLGAVVRVARDADELTGADRIILPGVGAAKPAMALLHQRGFATRLQNPPAPLLGICLGMQLLYTRSAEGDVACLGLLPGKVEAMRKAEGIRLPHMGWNTLKQVRWSALTAGLNEGAQAYFVHGYAVDDPNNTVLASTHGAKFSALVQHGHVAGMQFHPERSSAVGRQLLINFLEWSP